MLCQSSSVCLSKRCSHAVSSRNAAILHEAHVFLCVPQTTEPQWVLSKLISGQTPGTRACLQAVRYYNAQLPYLSSNPAVSYVFGYDNVLPGAAYLLAEATNFKNASFVHQVRLASVMAMQVLGILAQCAMLKVTHSSLC